MRGKTKCVCDGDDVNTHKLSFFVDRARFYYILTYKLTTHTVWKKQKKINCICILKIEKKVEREISTLFV